MGRPQNEMDDQDSCDELFTLRNQHPLNKETCVVLMSTCDEEACVQ